MDHETSWPDLKVLITGASGFLGSHLLRCLSNLGAEIHATSRVPRSVTSGGPCWWHSSLTDIESVREIFSKVKPDIVYHMAGYVGASPSRDLVLPTFQSLLASTINVLIGASEIGCRRVILSGSLTEPGASESYATPSSPYAAAKWAASGYGRMFHSLYNLPTVIVTPFMTYGPGQDVRKLIPSVILSLLRNEDPQLSSGQWEADWVFVDDVIRGFLTAAIAPAIEGATVELGTGTKRSIREVVEMIARLMDSPSQLRFGAVRDRPMEPIRIADNIETQRKLGWKAQTSLQDGLLQTIKWYTHQFSGDKTRC
jgi:UDP-glucose 4-epimerase